MTLKDKIWYQLKKLKEIFKFLTNSKHRLFIFLIWIFSIISLIIFPIEIINTDNLLSRTLFTLMFFFLFYTIIYMIFIYSNSNKEFFDIDTVLTSKYMYLVYFVLFLLLIFLGMQIAIFIIGFFFVIILLETIFFLVIPSSLLIKYFKKRNKSISQPLFYIGIVLFISLVVILCLMGLRSASPHFDFGIFEISFWLIMLGLSMVILTIIPILIRVIFVKDRERKHIKLIFILIITIVALVMVVYRLIIYILNYELDVVLSSLSIGLSIFKSFLLIFIIFSIELNEAGDINDKRRSDKSYLNILLVQTFMLFEELISRSLFETNSSPTYYPVLIIPFIVIPAIIWANFKLNRIYKKNPNALKNVLILPQQKTNQYWIICIVIAFVALIFFGIFMTLILQYFQK